MRKQAEQLVVGRVYADIKEDKLYQPSFMRFEGKNNEGFPLFRCVAGNGCYVFKSETFLPFCSSQAWFELTPEEDAIYNKPSEPTFTLSDIQRVIERIEREARFISDEDSDYDRHWVKFRDKAIEIMREELKLK